MAVAIGATAVALEATPSFLAGAAEELAVGAALELEPAESADDTRALPGALPGATAGEESVEAGVVELPTTPN